MGQNTKHEPRASIVKRKDQGGYRVYYYDPDGRRHSPSFGTEQEAKAFAAKLEHPDRGRSASRPVRGQGPNQAQQAHAQDLDLAEAASLFLKAKKHRLAEPSIRNYADVVTAFIKNTTPGTAVQEVNRFMAEDYLNGLIERNLAPTTANHHLRHLKAIWNWFVQQDLVQANPWRQVDLFTVDPKAPALVPPEKVADFLAACTPEFKPVAILAVYAGLRRREVINLTWFDVDLKRGTLLIQQSKSHKPRRVPLHPVLKAELERLCKAKTSEYVFPGAKGDKRYSEDTWLNRSTKQAAWKAGIKTKVTFHGLRATCATLMAAAGVGETAIRDLLGHHDTSITRVYLGLGIENLRSAIERISVGEVTKSELAEAGAVAAPTPAPTT